MKIVHKSPNELEAYVLVDLLKNSGISAEILGEHSQGLNKLQSSGFINIAVQLENYDSAKKIVEEYTKPVSTNTPEPTHKHQNSIKPLLWGIFIGAILMACFFYLPVSVQKLDKNRDGEVDGKITYIKRQLSATKLDRNFDGNFDFRYIYSRSGELTSAEADDDFDGKFETVIKYQNDNVISAQIDSDNNGFQDIKAVYENGTLKTITLFNPNTKKAIKRNHFSPFKLVLSEFDTNGDGHFDKIYEYDEFEEIKIIRDNK